MNPADPASLNATARSHPGMSGKNNEDRYALVRHEAKQQASQPYLLAIVSDGIGGHRAGEVAADLAVQIISRDLAESDQIEPAEELRAAIIRAGRAIYQHAQLNDNQQGMGATCAVAWVLGDHLYIATVGDSRIYLLRQGEIRQISTDHTWIQEAIENGVLTPEQARSHPNAHVIRRYLGSRQAVVPDMRLRLYPDENDAQAEANQGLHILPGDRLVLCSDGLTDLVNETEILEIFQQKPQEQALDALVDLANQRGGHDNITLVALHVMPETVAALPASERHTRWIGLPCAVAGLLIAALTAGVLLVGILVTFRYGPWPDFFPNLVSPSRPAFTEPAFSAPIPSTTATMPPALPPTSTLTPLSFRQDNRE